MLGLFQERGTGKKNKNLQDNFRKKKEKKQKLAYPKRKLLYAKLAFHLKTIRIKS